MQGHGACGASDRNAGDVRIEVQYAIFFRAELNRLMADAFVLVELWEANETGMKSFHQKKCKGRNPFIPPARIPL